VTDKRALVEEGLRDIVEDLGARPPVPSRIDADKAAAAHTPAPACRVYCLPARADRDELAGAMLVQLLQQQGFEAQSAPTKLGVGELIGLVKKAGVDVVCISVVAPSTVLHARYLCLKLRALLPKQRIVVGLWGATENVTDAARRVRDSGADEVVTTLADAVLQLAKRARPRAEQMTPAPIPADEEEEGASG
jgi:methylmalonyl-CoA mutase cobalamin-binding subunit